MKKILAFFVIGTLALANYPVVTLYSDDLARVPGEVLVSPGFQTYIEFFDTVEKAGFQQDGPYAVTTQDNFVIITTKTQSGTGDLWVRVQGRTHFLNLKTAKGVSLRPYKVERERPQRAVSPTNSTPAAPATQRLPLPETLNVQMLSAGSGTSGEAVVQYLIRNNGMSSITISLSRLAITQAGSPRTPRLIMGNQTVVVAPGSFTAGAFAVNANGPLTLEWDLVEVGSSRTYVFRNTLNPGTSATDTR